MVKILNEIEIDEQREKKLTEQVEKQNTELKHLCQLMFYTDKLETEKLQDSNFQFICLFIYNLTLKKCIFISKI